MFLMIHSVYRDLLEVTISINIQYIYCTN